MKVYLDTNGYNRPFDGQEQPRIWLETLAFAVILQMVDAGSLRDLRLWSEALGGALFNQRCRLSAG